jgi:hypothetical protein
MTLWERVRQKGQHHLHHRVDAELNLIPLIDILSVMVAFLLVYSTNVEIVQNTKGVEVPQSTSEVPPKVSVVVMITKDNLFVQGELVASQRCNVAGCRDRCARDHGAGGQDATVRRRQEGDVDLHGRLVRQDFTRSSGAGETRPCRKPEAGLRT